MWIEKNRARYARPTARYASDLTDAESAEIGSLIPPAKQGGNKRTVCKSVPKRDHRQNRVNALILLMEFAQGWGHVRRRSGIPEEWRFLILDQCHNRILGGVPLRR